MIKYTTYFYSSYLIFSFKYELIPNRLINNITTILYPIIYPNFSFLTLSYNFSINSNINHKAIFPK